MCFLELIHSRNKFFSNFKTSILAVYSYIFASMYVRDLSFICKFASATVLFSW